MTEQWHVFIYQQIVITLLDSNIIALVYLLGVAQQTG